MASIKVDLLFTDLGLHEDLQAGLKAAQEAVKRVPSLPVLYTTGQGVTDGMRPCSSSVTVSLRNPISLNNFASQSPIC